MSRMNELPGLGRKKSSQSAHRFFVEVVLAAPSSVSNFLRPRSDQISLYVRPKVEDKTFVKEGEGGRSQTIWSSRRVGSPLRGLHDEVCKQKLRGNGAKKAIMSTKEGRVTTGALGGR